MKKSFKILAITLAAGMVGGLAACSSSSSQLTFDSYWYRANYAGIQNSAVNGDPEVLYYEIGFEEGSNDVYSVEYDDGGYYMTELTTVTFDWSDQELTYADYRSDDTEVVYKLTTEMYVSGRYIYEYDGSNATVEFSDYVETVTYFRSARNTLSPLYSRQSVRSTSPNGISPTSDDMCKTVQYEYEVFYNRDASETTYTYTAYDTDSDHDDGTDGSYTLTVLEDECFEDTVTGLDDGYTLLDNNSLYTSIRGMSLSSSFSAVVSLFIPAQGGTYDVSITGGDEGTLDTENETDSTIYNALTEAYGEPETTNDDGEQVINYNTVSITSNSTLSGTTQTAWYAAVEDEDDNQYRATLLYLEVPLSYGLGTLTYTLSEVESVLGANAKTSE